MLYASRVSGVIDLAGRPAMATLYVIHTRIHITRYEPHTRTHTQTRVCAGMIASIHLKKQQRVRVYVIWVRSERLEIH